MSKTSKILSIPKLEALAVDALEDVKGRDIVIVNTMKLSQMFERIILASGDSNRQVRALARSVADKVRKADGEILSVEGEETGEWVLVDLGPVVVHIMQPFVRLHFDLEGLWGIGKPVGVSAKKAAAKFPAKKPAAKKLGSAKIAAKKATKSTSSRAKKSAT